MDEPRGADRSSHKKMRKQNLGVKQELAGAAAPVAAARKLAQTTTRDSLLARTNTTAESEGSSSRRVRSGAPSIETRPHLTSHPGDEVTTVDDEETEKPILMEVRPRVKSSSEEEEALPSQNKSFASTHMAFQLIGQRLKTINDALGKLQTLGIQHVTSLPELVLVGDQSSGKSSLMSALANLNLPRSTGICTRCPIHIRTSSGSSSWRCNVSLHQDYRFLPQHAPINDADVTAHNPFPPWRKMPQRVVQDFKTIEFTTETVSADVEQVIRWAQVAILNDGDDYRGYIPKISTEDGYQGDASLQSLLEHEANTMAKFSPNRVALEIRGPDLADMSFYDLPGVFANTPDLRDEYLVKVVQNLASEYISHPSAIILWAVPMNADPDTAETFKLIRNGGALERCVAVLTKADLVPHAGHAQWVDLLKGRSYQTGLGYYITTRPQTNEPDAFEESYFNRQAHAPHSTLTWPEEFSEFEDKCGVSKLKVVLSQKLGEEFAKSVPQVRRKIEAKLRHLEQQLKKHPDLPQNAELEIRRGIAEFTAGVHDYFGKHAHSDWAGIQEGFARQILHLKPRFIVKPEEPYRVEANGVINIADTESVVSAASTPMKRRHPSDEQAVPFATPAVKRRAGPNGIVKLEDRSPFATPTGRVALFTSPGIHGRRPGRTLKQVRQIIQDHKCPGKPDLIPEEVYEVLCREAIEPWDQPLDQLVRDTTQTLNLQLASILSRAFVKLDKRAIYKQAGEHVRAFVKDAMATLACRLHDLYRLETRQLFTMNIESMRRHREDERRTLDRHRHYYRAKAHFGDRERPQPKDWTAMTEEEKTQEAVRTGKEAQKLGKDDFEPELHVASYVRGYYLTASSRYIDTALLHITSGVFPDLASQISGYLDCKLSLPRLGNPIPATSTVFDELMAEDAKDVQTRNFLKRELEKFNQAKASIQSLESPTANAGIGDTDVTLVSEEDDDDDVLADEDMY